MYKKEPATTNRKKYNSPATVFVSIQAKTNMFLHKPSSGELADGKNSAIKYNTGTLNLFVMVYSRSAPI